MSKATIIFCTIGLVNTFAAVRADPLDYKPRELIVRFAPRLDGKQLTVTERNEVLALIKGGTVKHCYKLVPGLSLVKLPAGQRVEEALNTFNKTCGILYAEPNYKIYLASTFPNDTYFGQLWGMHNTGQTGGEADADIDAPEAWDIANTSSDIILVVIDSGQAKLEFFKLINWKYQVISL